ncbi:MAG TPA: hypothetical protein VLA25_05480 [Methylotenera sp.]|nr:hypothetical protein [Methylotenera sp.]
MENEFFLPKIKQLTDERLKELIRLKTKENQKIIALAEKEAVDRGIDLKTIDLGAVENGQDKNKTKEDKGLNWLGVIADFLSEL